MAVQEENENIKQDIRVLVIYIENTYEYIYDHITDDLRYLYKEIENDLLEISNIKGLDIDESTLIKSKEGLSNILYHLASNDYRTHRERLLILDWINELDELIKCLKFRKAMDQAIENAVENFQYERKK